MGEKVKAVSCVAWNEGVGDWAAGCSDGKLSDFDFFVLDSADCFKVLSEFTDEVGSFLMS
jgi:hypothetical protein